MIKKYIAFSLLFFIFSCSNIEFVLKDSDQPNPLKNKTLLVMDKNTEERFISGIYSYFGNSENHEYILKTKFLESKENRVVKKNQVAEKIDYTLKVKYDLFFKTRKCRIFNKTVITRFSFTPKSAGYNFGSDRSFDKLYSGGVNQNIKKFIDALEINKSCLE